MLKQDHHRLRRVDHRVEECGFNRADKSVPHAEFVKSLKGGEESLSPGLPCMDTSISDILTYIVFGGVEPPFSDKRDFQERPTKCGKAMTETVLDYSPLPPAIAPVSSSNRRRRRAAECPLGGSHLQATI
jgi:hypothetical protein